MRSHLECSVSSLYFFQYCALPEDNPLKPKQFLRKFIIYTINIFILIGGIFFSITVYYHKHMNRVKISSAVIASTTTIYM